MSVSTGGDRYVPSQQERYENPWRVAIREVEEDVRRDFSNVEKVDALGDVLDLAISRQQDSFKRRWSLKKHNNKVAYFHENYSKIVAGLQRFKEIGDLIVQYDPAHAALPWAAVRFFLQTTISQHETDEAMLQGMAAVSDLIAHYQMVEKRYLQDFAPASESREALNSSLAKLYASILTFLGRACRHYKQCGPERILKALSSGTPAAIDQLFKRMSLQQQDVDRRLDLVNREDNREDQENRREETKEFSTALEEIQYRNVELLDIAGDIREAFTHAKRQVQVDELVHWLGDIPYYRHHDAAKTGRLPGSGIWLKQRPEYKDWWTWKTSAIFWLTGTLGMGKSALISNVIDTLSDEIPQRTDPDLLAYFYISKNPSETFRTDSVEIFRSLVRQLGAPNATGVNKKLLHMYERSKETYGVPRKPSISECIEIILELTNSSPLVLVIDALDEMPVGHLNELLRGIGEIIRNAARPVKLFVSSRNDLNTVSHLKDAKNFHFSIKSSDNRQDIERFVRQEVETLISNGALLGIGDADLLKEEIIDVLLKRAQGMFRWVSMQLNSLFDPNKKFLSPDDVRDELRKPAKDLDAEYVSALERIDQTTSTRRVIATRILMWLLCSERLLAAGELHVAVAVDKNGAQIALGNITWEEIVGMCYSMVSFDVGQKVFRFAHASVPEFLDMRDEYSQSLRHAEVARRCFEILFNRHRFARVRDGSRAEHEGLLRYAMVFWPTHYMHVHPLDRSTELKDRMKSLLFRGHEGSQFFKDWLQDVQKEADVLNVSNELSRKLLLSVSPNATPLFLASIFNMPEALLYIKKRLPRFDFQQRNAQGRSALDLAIEYGYEDIVRILLEAGVEINSFNVEATAQFEDIQITEKILEILHFVNPLRAAAASGNPALVELLLESGARNIIGGYYGDALQAASFTGNIQTVENLLSRGAGSPASGFEVNSQCGYHGNALQAAAAKGHHQIMALLTEEGADVNSRGGHYGHALIASLWAKQIQAVVVLLRFDADANASSKRYGTAVQLACSSDSERVLESVLEKGANSEGLKAENPYLLHHAARNDLVYLADFLLRRGYDLELKDGTPGQAHWTPLMLAARYGREDVLQLLLNAGADMFALDNDGASPIHLAAEMLEVSTVRRLLAHILQIQKRPVKDLINKARHQNGWTALREAVQRDNLDLVKVLVEAGATLVPDNHNVTPLHHVAAKGYLSILQFFLSCNADIGLNVALNHRNFWGRTPLTDAVLGRHTEAVKALIEHGGSVFYEDNETMTPLESAAKLDLIDMVTIFLNMGEEQKKKSHFSTLHRTREGFTALQFAAKYDARRVLELLVEQDCDCRPNSGGWTALHEATNFCHPEIVEILLKAMDKGTHVKNLDINLRKPQGATALNIAAGHGDTRSVELLLSRNCNINIDDWQSSPFHNAAEKGHLEVVRALLAVAEARSLIDSQNCWKRTALFYASREGRWRVVQLLLNEGANYKLQDEKGETCLHVTAPSQTEIVWSLLARAKENNDLCDFVGICNHQGRTALHYAADNGNINTAQQLISLGASYKAESKDRITPLHAAAWNNHPKVVGLLLKTAEQFGDHLFINCKNNKHQTPLIDAASRGATEAAQILLNHGADVNICDNDGQNALHYSAWRNHKGVVELLLRTASACGPDTLKRLLDQQNVGGRNALLDTGIVGYLDILQMLLDYGSDWAAVGKGRLEGKTVLMYAAEYNKIEVIRTVAKAAFKANDKRKILEWVSRREANNFTALEWAFRKGNYQAQEEIQKILDRCK